MVFGSILIITYIFYGIIIAAVGLNPFKCSLFIVSVNQSKLKSLSGLGKLLGNLDFLLN